MLALRLANKSPRHIRLLLKPGREKDEFNGKSTSPGTNLSFHMVCPNIRFPEIPLCYQQTLDILKASCK